MAALGITFYFIAFLKCGRIVKFQQEQCESPAEAALELEVPFNLHLKLPIQSTEVMNLQK